MRHQRFHILRTAVSSVGAVRYPPQPLQSDERASGLKRGMRACEKRDMREDEKDDVTHLDGLPLRTQVEHHLSRRMTGTLGLNDGSIKCDGESSHAQHQQPYLLSIASGGISSRAS